MPQQLLAAGSDPFSETLSTALIMFRPHRAYLLLDVPLGNVCPVVLCLEGEAL